MKLVLALALVTPGAAAQSGASGQDSVQEEVTASPNRPSNSDSANVLAPGVLQMEHGWAGGWPVAGRRDHALGGVFRFGVARNLELHWGWDALLRLRDRTGARHGTGDNFLGLQYRFIEESDSSLAFAVSYTAKLPSASERKGLGSGEVDHALTFLASKAVGAHSFDFNAIYRVLGRAGAAGHDAQGVFFFTYA